MQVNKASSLLDENREHLDYLFFTCREAQATLQMVEMYLHPEIEVMWAQAEQGLGPDQQPLQANLEAVAAAQRLLNDVHVTDDFAVQHKASQRFVCLWLQFAIQKLWW